MVPLRGRVRRGLVSVGSARASSQAHKAQHRFLTHDDHTDRQRGGKEEHTCRDEWQRTPQVGLRCLSATMGAEPVSQIVDKMNTQQHYSTRDTHIVA